MILKYLIDSRKPKDEVDIIVSTGAAVVKCQLNVRVGDKLLPILRRLIGI
jgi:hypothetical protein